MLLFGFVVWYDDLLYVFLLFPISETWFALCFLVFFPFFHNIITVHEGRFRVLETPPITYKHALRMEHIAGDILAIHLESELGFCRKVQRPWPLGRKNKKKTN